MMVVLKQFLNSLVKYLLNRIFTDVVPAFFASVTSHGAWFEHKTPAARGVAVTLLYCKEDIIFWT